MHKSFTVLWLVWMAAFGLIEYFAIARHSGGTLSEFIWRLIGHPVMYFPFAGFLVWLVLHFLTLGRVRG